VFGGGHVGLMGAVADGALDAGGAAVGVIPRALVDRELAHEGLTELHVVESMHERKALMATLADGFVALPGGLGTFEELFEVWTWGQLGIHAKPFGLLNVAGYYGALLEFLDHSASQGFVRPGHRDLLLVDSDPVALLARMVDYRPPTVAKWMDRTET
jgi:uncharacterized protein (TIGR00730 family)